MSESDIKQALEDVRPQLQKDGGDIEYVSYKNGIVKVKFLGQCASCPMQNMTLNWGVAQYLFKKIPTIKKIVTVNNKNTINNERQKQESNSDDDDFGDSENRNPNDDRSDVMNPNNDSHKASDDNRSNQMNPNNPAYGNSRGHN